MFLQDAQALGFLSPRLSDFAASVTTECQEAANGIKLLTAHGDIDFIVAGDVSDQPPEPLVVEGQETLVETPTEILAKKIQYRGIAFAQRDIFDLAVMMRVDPTQADAAIRACTRDALEATAQAIASKLPRLAAELPGFVNPTPRYRTFITDVPGIVREFPGVPALARAKRRKQ